MKQEDKIHLLPDAVASQIAAGEVIQRPASVVKELLENSMDAGSTSITLIIKEGGKTLIQVNDNGCGMSETDARMAWERHATSKLKTAEDLYNIRTMGFRGEALASIASVAHVELRTREHHSDLGIKILIEGSEIKTHEHCQCPPGTSIRISNLFYNIPARRKFLKSNPAETRHIIDEFTRVALARPDIQFVLYNNDTIVYDLKPTDLLYRILQMHEDRKVEQYIAVNEQTTIAKISGYVGVPQAARKTRGEQFFFVNGRFFKDALLNHAVVAAYEGLITKENFPSYIIKVDVATAKVDVNVHPSKTEVKFEEEKFLYQVLKAVVKKSLGNFVILPAPNFDTSPFQITSTDPLKFIPPPVENAASKVFSPHTIQQEKKENKNWKTILDPFQGTSFSERFQKSEDENFQQQQIFVPEKNLYIEIIPQNENNFLQIQNSYIVFSSTDGMWIIDQQAAHERILYEQYMASFSAAKMPVQEKLFPQMVELNIADMELISELSDDLNHLGFDIALFGKNCVIVNGIPSDIKNINEKELLEGMLESFRNTNNKPETERRETLVRSMASRTAIKHNQLLEKKEMQEIIKKLFACNNPNYDPSGKIIYKKLNGNEIEKLMK